MAKKYKLTAGEIVAGLAANESCFVTDRVTVDGMPVGFMYREGAQWNFFAGDEDQEYVDDPSKSAADSPQQRLREVKRISSPERYGAEEWETNRLLYYTCRLDENNRKGRHTLYGSVISEVGHVLLAVYLDAEDDVVDAEDFVGRVSTSD